MAGANVLVVFYSGCGETERLASIAAVGAVQARANIRLRRITDPNGAEVGPDGRDALERMRQGYIPPAAADVRWADALIFASPEHAPHWPGLTEMLVDSGGSGHVRKVALVLDPTSSALPPVIASLGWTLLDPGPGTGSVLHRALVRGRLAAMAATASPETPPVWRDGECLLPDAHDLS